MKTIQNFLQIIESDYNRSVLLSLDSDGNKPTYQVKIKHNEDDSISYVIQFNQEKSTITRLILNTKETLSERQELDILESIKEKLKDLNLNVV